MDTLTNGLSQGDFTLLNVLHNGSMQNIITLIAGLGGGNVDSANAPLSISGGVLSIDLSSYTNTAGLTTLLADKLDTSHEAGKIGNTNVAFGAFDINTRTVTLQNSNGVTVTQASMQHATCNMQTLSLSVCLYVSLCVYTCEYILREFV